MPTQQLWKLLYYSITHEIMSALILQLPRSWGGGGGECIFLTIFLLNILGESYFENQISCFSKTRLTWISSFVKPIFMNLVFQTHEICADLDMLMWPFCNFVHIDLVFLKDKFGWILSFVKKKFNLHKSHLFNKPDTLFFF